MKALMLREQKNELSKSYRKSNLSMPSSKTH